MTPEDQQAIDLVLAILDATAAPQWQADAVFALARRFLDERARQERGRCLDKLRDLARRYPETSDRAVVLRFAVAELERSP